ncbi:DNA mismatch endonuclease Vsr [Methylococcaceae bacterium WWC4]|nr:DNA mismatch endonuclease Vsr [Methylococcaceae bacterium WWC4]
MDKFSKEKRSEIMSKIRSKDTSPELKVRKLVFSLGYRYRLHDKNLLGRPDLVFHERKKVIFIHGCFWHQHKDCALAQLPASNLDYWKPKLARTVERDKQQIEALQRDCWDVLVIWECEIKQLKKLEETIRHFLGPAKTKTLTSV